MRLPPPKRRYCAYCGLVNQTLGIVWQDEEGRVFRFHRKCGKLAELEREKLSAPPDGSVKTDPRK